MRENKYARYMKDFLWPVDKKGINTRSLDYFRLVMKPKRDSVVFAAIPRSGSTWAVRVLNGYFQSAYSTPRAVSPADSRAKYVDLREYGLPIDHIYFTHQWWGYSPLGLRNCARYVFLYRDLPTALYSLHHRKARSPLDIPQMVKRDPKFPGTVELLRKAFATGCLKINYRNLRTEPHAWFGVIIHHLTGVVHHSVLHDVLHELSFDNAPLSNAYRGATSYRDEMGEYVYEELARMGVSHV